MYRPGEVVRFNNLSLGKLKYHLCISVGGHFLFINSPKPKSYLGDFVVSCQELPFLPATESGKSVISCNLVMRKDDQELRHLKATKMGKVAHGLLVELLKFVEASPVIPDETKDDIVNHLAETI